MTKRIAAFLVPLLVLLLIAVPVAFPPRARMRAAVAEFGFDRVAIGGFAWLGCGNDDVFRRRWTARRAGRPVAGVVCGGLGKGWTVRLTGAPG